MTEFMAALTGLEPTSPAGATADMFTLADGSVFAVAPNDEPEPDIQTLGFLVDDAAAAHDQLEQLGVELDELRSNEWFTYFHFIAPDGFMYEIVQDLRT